MGAVTTAICFALDSHALARLTVHSCKCRLTICCIRLGHALQIEGDHSMEAVASAISAALDQAYAKIGDPLEDFCASNPEQPECLVYDD